LVRDSSITDGLPSVADYAGRQANELSSVEQ